MNERFVNPVFAVILPFIIGGLYSLALGCLSSLLNVNLSFFLLINSYLIGGLFLRYLNHFTTLHKILAAVYAFIAFFLFRFMFNFLQFSKTFADINALHFIFSRSGLRFIIFTLSFFDWLILIILPVSAYFYLDYYGNRSGF